MEPVTAGRRAHHESMPTDPAMEAEGAECSVQARPSGTDFPAFVREHEAALVSFLSARTHVEDAKDLAQESLLRLMRYRGHPPDQLKPLMYRIALNTLNDHGRRMRSRFSSLHDSLDQDTDWVPSGELPHDQRVANAQELARLRMALLQLPIRCRQVYLLNRIDGMSYSQIARHCDISVKCVEKHISKALTILRTCLLAPNPHGVDGP